MRRMEARMSDPARKPDTGDDPVGDLDRESTSRLPRWAWVALIIVAVVILLFVVVQFTGVLGGDHRPGRPPGGH